MRLGLLLRTMPYTHENFDTAYHLTLAALAAAHEVRLFLYEDSVVGACAHINSGTERNLGQRVGELAARGVEVSACATCCRFRGLGRDDLVPGVNLAGLGALARMIEECDRVVTLGA
jgi:sulfur relay (sulfurtransferase) complex TusBCD TusD component (DsrE family)